MALEHRPPRTMAAIPALQRPRERLVDLGPESLADAELLAILLGTGTRGRSALDLAHDLLADYCGPSGLAGAETTELARRTGIGPAKAARVIAAFSLGRRISPPAPRLQLRDTESIAHAVRPWLADARRERLVVVVCDTSLRLRRAFVITEGAADRCLVPVREILTAVLLHDGAGFAVAHNHPSGRVQPSEADEEVTAALRCAADAVGLQFLGHLVIAGDRWARCPERTQ